MAAACQRPVERGDPGEAVPGPGRPTTPAGIVPPPLYPEVGILALVPDQWTTYWQPRHQVVSRLAAFFSVAWVPPTPGRFGGLSPVDGIPGLRLYDPPWYLPSVLRPAPFVGLLYRARLAQVRRGLAGLGARRFVTYLWRPTYAPALAAPHHLSVYHIDDDYSFDAARVGLTPIEQELIQRVDQVVIHSPGLMSLKGAINPRTALVPNGVDYRAFSRPLPEPDDLAAVPRPRVGYAGWLKPQLDWALLDRLASELPGLSFVLVGPTKLEERLVAGGFGALLRRPNVHLLGPKSPVELAAYPQHFDVCAMPYCIDAYTDCIYPLKLHEYLASGRPVIGTPIRSLRDFAGTVALAEGPDQWRTAVGRALSEGPADEAARRSRQQIARAHDWWTLTGRIAELVAEGLGLDGRGAIRERAASLAAN